MGLPPAPWQVGTNPVVVTNRTVSVVSASSNPEPVPDAGFGHTSATFAQTMHARGFAEEEPSPRAINVRDAEPLVRFSRHAEFAIWILPLRGETQTGWSRAPVFRSPDRGLVCGSTLAELPQDALDHVACTWKLIRACGGTHHHDSGARSVERDRTRKHVGTKGRAGRRGTSLTVPLRSLIRTSGDAEPIEGLVRGRD